MTHHGDDLDPSDGFMAAGRDRLARFSDWRRRLTYELAELPETLRRVREGSANFALVSERLSDTSESLEEITALYQATMADTTRRSAEAAEVLREQIDGLVGQSPERVVSTLGELQGTLQSLADLNPFWPSGDRKEPTD